MQIFWQLEIYKKINTIKTLLMELSFSMLVQDGGGKKRQSHAEIRWFSEEMSVITQRGAFY